MDRPAPARRRLAPPLEPVGAALAAALLVGRWVVADPLRLAIGAVRTEAPRHFWGLWAAAAHLREWGPFVVHIDVAWPRGYTRHLMDPVDLVPFLPVYWLLGGGVEAATLAYDAVHVFWAVLGAVGGWLLARRLLGPERAGTPAGRAAALVVSFAAGSTPYFMATPWLGRTELLAGVAWPLHLALLDRALAPDARRRHLLAAGLSLAAIALGGWYLASWLLLFEPVAALLLARRHPGTRWRTRLLRLVAVAVLAVLPVLPALRALLAWPPPVLGEEQRVSVHMGICTPPWMLLPFTGNQGLPGTDLPAYPGTVVFGLAALGAAIERRARPWFLVALAMIALSLGPFLVWTNDASALTADPPKLPAYWVEKLLPPLRYIWGWCRIGILYGAPLGAAALWGLVALFERARAIRPQLLAALLAVIAVDHARGRAPAGIVGAAFETAPPAALLEGLAAVPPGPILQLPLDDFYMVWQLAHGRPVAEALEIEPVRQHNFLVQWTTDLVEARLRGEDVSDELSRPGLVDCLSDAGMKLAEEGFAAVVLHRDRAPGLHRELTHLFTRTMGRPVYDVPGLAVWRPAGRPAPEGTECPVHEIEVLLPPPPGGEGAGMQVDDAPGGG